MVTPLIAGEALGTAAVLTRYPSMVDWAKGGAKLQSSDEWSEFLAAFPIDKYQIVYQGLSQAVDID